MFIKCVSSAWCLECQCKEAETEPQSAHRSALYTHDPLTVNLCLVTVMDMIKISDLPNVCWWEKSKFTKSASLFLCTHSVKTNKLKVNGSYHSCHI